MKKIFSTIAILTGAMGLASVQASTVHAQITSGGVYTLNCKTSGLVLDNEGSMGPTTNVWQYGYGNGSSNQEWTIRSVGSGEYSLVCLTSGLALDSNGSTTSGSLVCQNTPIAGDTGQEWSITSVGGGYYRLINKASGLALDNSGSTSYGGTIRQWTPASGNTNQQWLIAPVQFGAATPFTEYEAEAGRPESGAAIVKLTAPPTTQWSSPALEASGHAYVNLAATGQSVSWTNNTGKSITAINVRYSIPDAPGGGGITSTIDLYVNGVKRQAIPVNSKQTWLYETASQYDGMSKTPNSNPHVFWDEVHTFITGAAVAPGSSITLKKDASNSASYYSIDLVDLETPPAPLTQPANSLSITSYGAVANNNSVDSTTAIENCIAAAQSSGKSVWIPQGTFYINQEASLYCTGITIQGAGMWYSTVYYNPPLPTKNYQFVFQPTSCNIANFAIDGVGEGDYGTQANAYSLNIKGDNWTVNSVWIQHEGPVWADGNNAQIANCRINNTWGDGINVNNGDNGGSNMTVTNNFVRGTGDDGIAINDQGKVGNPNFPEMTNITILDNTVVAPWWADNIGIYGGDGVYVRNNVCHETTREFGMNIGLFGGNGYLQHAYIQGNKFTNCGSYGYGIPYAGVGVGVTVTPSTFSDTVFTGNTINNAMFDGLDIDNGANLYLCNNTISAAGNIGFDIIANAGGSAYINANTVTNVPSGQSAFTDSAPNSNFSVSGYFNNGFVLP